MAAKQILLTADNSLKFRARPNGPIKLAFTNDEPTIFFKAAWGNGVLPGFQGFGVLREEGEKNDPFRKVVGIDPAFTTYLTIVMPHADGRTDTDGAPIMDIYGADKATFLNEHVAVEGVPNGYRAAKKILAVRLTEETEVKTRLKSGAYDEATTVARAGNWLWQQPNGEQQVGTDEQFNSLYERFEW